MSFAAPYYPARQISHKRLNFRPLATWLPPLAVTTVQWLSTKNHVTPFHALLACLLLWMPWFSYCRWQDRGGPVAPLFAVVAMAHWLSFGSLLFWGPPPADPIYQIPFSEATLSGVLGMAVLGMFSLRAGMKVPLRLVRVEALPDLMASPKTAGYLHLVLGVCAVAALINDSTVSALGGLRSVVEIFRSTLPHTVFAILMWKYLKGKATPRDKAALLGYAVLRAVLGVASGWLGSAITLGVVGCLVYIQTFRRLPTRALLVIVPLVLFFQAGKETFRQVYWSSSRSGATTEKIAFWVSTSFDVWSKALTGQSAERHTSSLVIQTFQRVSLLDQAGNVYDKTPGEVPLQMGKSYSYLIITLIPRFIWPDKPSVNDANRFYQVAYGMTAEQDLDSVSIAVGFLVESFMNFGWAGIVLVMFAMGLFLGFFERILLSARSGVLFNAIGVALLFNLFMVESQAAQYIGGLAQQIGLTVIVLAPVLGFRKAGKAQEPGPEVPSLA